MTSHPDDGFGRPCLECGEPVNSADDIEFHLHEMGLPGRLYRAWLQRQREQVATAAEGAPPAGPPNAVKP